MEIKSMTFLIAKQNISIFFLVIMLLDTIQKCLKCKKPFKSILRHLSKSQSCIATYSKEQLEDLRSASKQRKYAQTNEYRIKNYDTEKKSAENKQYYTINKSKIKESYIRNEKTLSKFFEEIKFGPIFPCVCCKRCLSFRGVILLREQFLKSIKENDIAAYIDLKTNLKIDDKFYLCHTCHRNLSKSKMPNLCFQNSLELAKVPECLQVSSLGNQLLAKHLIFLKIRPLIKTGMGKNNDRVSNSILFCLLLIVVDYVRL